MTETDRIRALIVILDDDYRNDDVIVPSIVNAILMIRGVARVNEYEPVTSTDIINRSVIALQFGEKIRQALQELNDDKTKMST